MSKRKWMRKVLAGAVFVLLMYFAGSKAMGVPVFNPDGSITCGNNGIILDGNGFLTINAGNVKILGRTALFKVDPETKQQRWFTTNSLEDKSLKVNVEKKQIIFKGTYNDKESGKSMEVSIAVSLGPEGIVKVKREFNPSELFKEKVLAGGYLYFESPYDNFIGHTVKVGKKSVVFKEGEVPKPPNLYGNPGKVIYFVDNPAMRIAFLPLNDINFTFSQSSRFVYLSFAGDFNLDLGLEEQSGESARPANYYVQDDLYGPRYDLCRNLIQNPSFEAGYRYWRQYSANFPNPNNFSIDSKISFRGKKSLRLYGRKGQRVGMGYVSTFAIPVELGQEYTLSFYARGDSPQKLEVMSREGLGNPPSPPWDKWRALKGDVLLTSHWKRYSFPFKAKDKIMSVIFHIQYPTEDCTAWIDAVQLEKGKLTQYTEKPVYAALATNHFDNLFEPGEPINARLEVHTLAKMKGRVELTLKDFFGEVVYKDRINFSANEDGFASLPIPLEKMSLPSGIYVLKADFTLSSGYNDQDYFRLGIMNYLDNKFKHKNMFATCYAGTAGVKLRAERMKRIGVGACEASSFNPLPVAVSKELQKNGILTFFSIFRLGNYAGESPSKEELDLSNGRGAKEYSVSTQGKANEKADLASIPLGYVEEWAAKKAAAHPEIRYWKLANEPLYYLKDNLKALKRYVLVMKAAYDGIKRGNPHAVVISPDQSNMSPHGGMQWMDTYLKAGGLKTFDIAAIHTYRKRPEEPDLDTDIATFISILKKHGYSGDIWLTEGMAWGDYIIPAYSFDTDFSVYTSDYRAGSLSYDLGYGEKLAAAYEARSWLTSLKYSSRVKMDLAWSPSLTDMDLNMTPHADAWVPNTLGHILGNAEYCRDIRVSDNIRSYLFRDGKKRPVAVFWNTSPAVDRRVRKGPVLTLPFKKGEVEIINLMGKVSPLADNGKLSITAFPVFVRGKPGTMASFSKRLSEDLVGSDVSRIKSSVKMAGAEKAEVRLQNALSAKVKGRIAIRCQGKTVIDKKVSFKGQGVKRFFVPVSRSTDTFEKVSLKVSFLPQGQSQPQIKDLSFILLRSKERKSKITIDGDLSDWGKGYDISLPDTFKNFPVPPGLLPKFPVPIPWKGKSDLSAILYSCWDKNNLYLAVKVKDDVFTPPPKTAGAYKYDSLQVYFDPLSDARDRKFKGFDEYDYSYDFDPLKAGPKVIRSWAPDWQIAFLKKGPAPEVKFAFRKVKGGMIYEIAFPARQIFPISLKAGSSFGFALLINDNDNDYRKRGLTLTPQGTEPYMRPDLYPVMVLVK